MSRALVAGSLASATLVLAAAALADTGSHATLTRLQLVVPADRESAGFVAEAVAGAISQAIGPAPGHVGVVVASRLPAAAPDAASLLADLRHQIVDVIAGRPGVRSVANLSGPASDVRYSGRGLDLVVLVTVSVERHRLVVDSRVQRLRAGFAGLVWPTDVTLARLVARVSLDAHLQSYVGFAEPARASRLRAVRLRLPDRGYVTASVQDLNADGQDEIVLTTASLVRVLRLRVPNGGPLRLVSVGRRPLPDLGRSPANSRREVGTSVGFESTVSVRHSGQARPFRVRLSAGDVVVEEASGPCSPELFPVSDGCAERVVGRDFYAPTLQPQLGGATPARSTFGFYARAARWIRTRTRDRLWAEAVVSPAGRIAVSFGSHRQVVSRYGAALAMTDLEDDGAPELLVSGASELGAGDELSVLRVTAEGGVVPAFQSERLTGSVLLAAAGDVNGDGAEELVAVEEPARAGRAHLWVLL